jgi:hypothetical protein
MTQPTMPRPAEIYLMRVINYLWCMEDMDEATKAGRFRLIGGLPKTIDPAEALIHPHSRSRLDECRRKTKAGQRMPPINCERIIVGPHTFYTVSDGNHRVAICRELGKMVPALIASQIVVDASRIIFLKTPAPALWWKMPGPPPVSLKLILWVGEVNSAEREALAWLLAEAAKPAEWRPMVDTWDKWPVGAGFEINSLDPYVFRKIGPSEADRFDRATRTWLGRITVTRSDTHQDLWGRRTWKDDLVESD